MVRKKTTKSLVPPVPTDPIDAILRRIVLGDYVVSETKGGMFWVTHRKTLRIRYTWVPANGRLSVCLKDKNLVYTVPPDRKDIVTKALAPLLVPSTRITIPTGDFKTILNRIATTGWASLDDESLAIDRGTRSGLLSHHLMSRSGALTVCVGRNSSSDTFFGLTFYYHVGVNNRRYMTTHPGTRHRVDLPPEDRAAAVDLVWKHYNEVVRHKVSTDAAREAAYTRDLNNRIIESIDDAFKHDALSKIDPDSYRSLLELIWPSRSRDVTDGIYLGGGRYL